MYVQEAKKILQRFENQNIDYVMVRNFQFLNGQKAYDGKDIDILVRTKEYKRIKKIFLSQGFYKAKICPVVHKGFIKYIPQEQKTLFFHLHLDGVAGAYLRYMSASKMLARKKKRNYYYIPSEEDQFLAVLLHTMLNKGRVKEKYEKQLREMFRKKIDEHYIQEGLAKKLNKKLAKQIILYIKNNDFKELSKMISKIRKQHKQNNLLTHYKTRIKVLAWGVLNLFNNAPLVSLIGMDGAGKSTALKEIKKVLDKNSFRYEAIYTGRGRNNLLPIRFFGRMYHKKKQQTEKKTKKQVKFRTKIIYTLAAPVFALDLILRYYFVILPKRKTKHLVLTDRYATDILLMANVPISLKKILFSLIPKPDIAIYLYNHPEVLNRRKKHGLTDLQRQEKIFLEITKRLNTHKIKTQSVEQTRKAIETKLFDFALKKLSGHI